VVATNGAGHLRQPLVLLARLGIPVGLPPHRAFPLRTAAARMAAVFGRVEVHAFGDGLQVTDPLPVVGYVASLTLLSGGRACLLHIAVAVRIATTGVFHVDRVAGLIIARRGRAWRGCGSRAAGARRPSRPRS